MSYDKLIEISSTEWSKLRDMYKINWPDHIIGHYTIDNYLRWIEREPQIENLHFYSLNGDWSDGTFLIVDGHQLFINTISSSIERLTKAISLLNWSHGYEMSTFLGRHRPAVLHTVQLQKLNKKYDHKTLTFYLPKEKAITLEVICPSDLYIRPISDKHAEHINSVWANKQSGSLFLLRRIIACNTNIGIFNKDDKLLAWCFQFQAGILGGFQVLNDYQRQGLGTLVLMAISKKIATELNQDIFACVFPENIPSIRTFEKVGFYIVGDTYSLRTYPLVRFKWTNNCE